MTAEFPSKLWGSVTVIDLGIGSSIPKPTIAKAMRSDGVLFAVQGYDVKDAIRKLDAWFNAPLKPPEQDIDDYLKSEEYLAYVQRVG
jgi:hypothetical protein